MAAPEVNKIAPPKANKIDSPSPLVPPFALRPVGITGPWATAPPPWSVDFVRPVPANSGRQRTPDTADNDESDSRN